MPCSAMLPCKPLVGSSILSPATNKISHFSRFEGQIFPGKPPWEAHGKLHSVTPMATNFSLRQSFRDAFRRAIVQTRAAAGPSPA